MKIIPYSSLTLLLVVVLGVAFAMPPLTGALPPLPPNPPVVNLQPPTSPPPPPPPFEVEQPDLPALESTFSRYYTTYQNAQLQRARSNLLHFHPLDLTKKRLKMQFHYLRLTLSDISISKRAKILSKINHLRLSGYRFAHEIDPGLHVRLGTPWVFDRFGPYPAKRLFKLKHWDLKKGEGERVVRQELENASLAMDGQSYLESDPRAGEVRLVYTDDVELLHSGMEYLQAKLGEMGRVRV